MAPSRAKPRSVVLSLRGIRGSQDLVTLMTALLSDLAAGRLTASEATAITRRAWTAAREERRRDP